MFPELDLLPDLQKVVDRREVAKLQNIIDLSKTTAPATHFL